MVLRCARASRVRGAPLQSAFCGRKHLVNIAEPLIRDTIKINQDTGGHTVDKKVNGSYSSANRAFRQKSPRQEPIKQNGLWAPAQE